MYQQIKPTEVFRERELALLNEAENRLVLGRLLHAGREAKARSTIAGVVVGFLAALVVASLMLAASSSPAHAESTFTVNSVTDFPDVNVGDGICDADLATGQLCTLRAAIQEANAIPPSADVINFNIPEAFRDPSSGVATFSPNSELPAITDKVTIDGYTQPDSVPNTLAKGTNAVLKIELNGANSGFPSPANGLKITAEGSDSAIKGLVINRFGAQGIRIAGDNVRIEGNFIGTDASGATDLGNFSAGILISDAGSTTVGGTASPAARNLISGNDSIGVGINPGSRGVKVLGNLVGTKKDGTTRLGNASIGVFILDAFNNTVSGNTIAFNARDGVSINDISDSIPNNANGNRVLSNSIFSNGELGIDLDIDGPDANDAGDEDSGANTRQNTPFLASATTSSTATTIKGRLNSTANKTFVVRFFSNPAGTDEGKTFLGQMSVSTDGLGKAPITKALAKVLVGKAVTATATSSGGDTSEFSAPRTVASA